MTTDKLLVEQVAKAIGREIALTDVEVKGGWLRAAEKVIAIVQSYKQSEKRIPLEGWQDSNGNSAVTKWGGVPTKTTAAKE